MGLTVKETSGAREESEEKQQAFLEVKFQRLAAAQVRTGGKARCDETRRSGMLSCGGRI